MTKTADVVIIGGGCMGASTAWHLVRRGITDVALVEREPQLALGSTGRNAGGVRHQFSHEANIRLSLESIRIFERFEEETGEPIDFWQHGYLFLLVSPRHVEDFSRSVALQQSLGVPTEWLAPRDAARLAPGLDTTGVAAATYCARDGICDPHGVTAGFAKAAQSRGAAILRGTGVTGILRDGRGVCGVATDRGDIATRVVVNAAGPWAGPVGRLAGIEVPVTPLRRHVFIAQPGGAEGWSRWDGGSRVPAAPASRIMVIDFETSFYFHREGAGLLFGMGDAGETPGFDTTVRWDFLEQVVDVAVTRLPVLADAAVSRAWAGLYEMTPDRMPILGPVPALPGFFVIAGFSGHGFQHSPAAGRVLADLIAGTDPRFDVAPFALQRFDAATASGEAYLV